MRPLAVFDIDGTLVDSRASIHRAACEAARDIGLPEPDYDRVRQIVGLSLEHAMAVLEPGLDAQTLARFIAGFRASFNRMYAEGHEEPLYPEAMTTLRRLHRDGWRLALATGQTAAASPAISPARAGPTCSFRPTAPRTAPASPIRPCSTPPWRPVTATPRAR